MNLDAFDKFKDIDSSDMITKSISFPKQLANAYSHSGGLLLPEISGLKTS